MAITVPQWVKANSGSTANFANTTTGNTLVACVTYASTTVTVATCKTTGNTFNKAVALPATNSTGGSCEIWDINSCVGETAPTVTLTWSGTAPSPITIDLFELHSSTAGSIVADDKTTSGANRQVSIAVTSMTPTGANEIVIACARCSATMSTATFTNTDLVTPAIRSEYTIQTTATAITAVGTDGAANTYNVAVVGAYKESAAQSVTGTGIASVTAFGTATVAFPPQAISATGIASTSALGTAVVAPGAVSIAPAGIASTNAFGTAVVAMPGSTFDVGYTTAGSQSGLYAGITCVKITLSQSGTLQSISFFAGSNVTGNSLLLGLYSDVSGAPSALLATTAATAGVVGLNTLATTTQPTLSPGDYWLAEQATVSVTGYYETPLGAGAWNGGYTWGGPLPNPISTVGSGPYAFSLYATFAGATGAQSITATGIASTTAFGTAIVAPGAVSITPAGIASVTGFGTATLLASAAITPSGIASTNAFGTAAVAPGAVSIAPSGIASTTAFGVATIGRGAVAITPSGIASTNAFGAATLSALSGISPAGIPPTNAFGTASISGAGTPQSIVGTGIASTTAFGTATIGRGAVAITPSGIASTNAFGTAAIAAAGAANIAPPGIASTNVFGVPTVARGVVNIAPTGIASVNAFGTAAVVLSGFIISPAGIGSVTAFGVAIIATGSVNIAARGISSVTAFGTARLESLLGNPVYPYAGQDQEDEIDVPAWIRYREDQWEDGPWIMPAYAWIFPPAPPVRRAKIPVPQRGPVVTPPKFRPPVPRRIGDPPPPLPPPRPKLIPIPGPRRMGSKLARLYHHERSTLLHSTAAKHD